MQTDENNEHEPKENKLVFAYANPWYFFVFDRTMYV